MIGAKFALAHARRRALDYMVSEIVIYRSAEPLFNHATGAITAGMENVIYRGTARIWGSSGAQTFSFGQSDGGIQLNYASIPWDTDPVPKRHDILYLVSTEIDAVLEGRTFSIVDVETGGQFRATRRLSIYRVEESQFFQDTP